MKKLIQFLSNWKTSTAGVIAAALSLLVLTGIIDLEQSQVIEDSANSLAENVLGIILAIQAVIGIFSRDADKSSEDSGVK